MNNQQTQVKKLTIRLWAGIFLVFVMILGGALFLYGQHVKALINDYTSKGPGSQLTATEWNNLDADFVNIPAGGCADGQVVQWSSGNWVCADAGGSGFGTRQDRTVGQIYTAADDLLVVAHGYAQPGQGFAGQVFESGVWVLRAELYSVLSSGDYNNLTFTMPVRDGEDWRVIISGASPVNPRLYEIPLSGGGGGGGGGGGMINLPGVELVTESDSADKTFFSDAGCNIGDIRASTDCATALQTCICACVNNPAENGQGWYCFQ